jgi:hypothetical protein
MRSKFGLCAAGDWRESKKLSMSRLVELSNHKPAVTYETGPEGPELED